MRTTSTGQTNILQAPDGYATRARVTILSGAAVDPEGHEVDANTLALYRLDEGSGSNFTDISGNGYTLTQAGTVGTGTGQIDTCRTFNGSSQYGSRTLDAALLTAFKDTTVSVSAWVKLDAAWGSTIAPYVFAGGSVLSGTAANNITLTMAVSNLRQTFVQFESGTNVLNQAIAAGVLTVGVWYHIAWVRNGTACYCYINGVSQALTFSVGGVNTGLSVFSNTPAGGDATNVFRIGANTSTGALAYFKGSLDDVLISSAELSNVDALEIYQRGLGSASTSDTDLTSLEGQDFLESVTIDENVDDPVAQATVNLKREIELYSLAPLHATSKLNLVSSVYTPLLRPGRSFKVETACIPLGVEPVTADWQEVFRGDIVEIDSGGDVLSFTGRDTGVRLQRAFIEDEVEYGLALGDPVEDVMQDILDDNGYAAVGLYTPASPGWDLGPYIQKREPVLEALRNLALQIGWDLRYRWQNVVSDWRLSFYEPERGNLTADWTWGAGTYREISTLKQSDEDVRNVVEVVYGDPTITDADIDDPRLQVTAEDATSIALYGRRWMQIAESSTSNIDTEVEAQRLADSALADLKEPLADLSVTVPYFWPVQLGDVHGFSANDVHFTASQALGIIGISHTIDKTSATTTLSLHGRVIGAHGDWLLRDARPGLTPTSPFTGPGAVSGFAATATPAGARLTFVPDPTGRPWEEYELHMSTSSSFTITAITLIAVSSTTSFDVTGLTPGVTHYFKVVGRDKQGNRGTASAEVSVTPLYVEARNLQPYVDVGALPPNADFEANNIAGSPPDTWSMITGSWGGVATISASSYSGANSLKLTDNGASATVIESQKFTIKGGEQYQIDAYVKSETATLSTACIAELRYYDSALAYIDSYFLELDTASNSVWYRKAIAFPTDSTARYASVRITRAAAETGDMYVDSVSVRRQSFVVQEWQNLSGFTNSWTASLSPVPVYTKNAAGEVRLGGQILAGTWNASAFTLPAGYRPGFQINFAVASQSNPALVAILASGEVVPVENAGGTPAGEWVSLDGITFRAEN